MLNLQQGHPTRPKILCICTKFIVDQTQLSFYPSGNNSLKGDIPMAATATKSDSVSGLFDQAVSTFGDALKAGVKIQEEVGKWWSDALEQAGPVTEWQKKSRAIFGDAIPTAQKNTEEWLKLVEQNYK